MRNTLTINFYQLIFGFPVPLIFAILLNELYSPKFKKVVQTVSYLPYFLSLIHISIHPFITPEFTEQKDIQQELSPMMICLMDPVFITQLSNVRM